MDFIEFLTHVMWYLLIGCQGKLQREPDEAEEVCYGEVYQRYYGTAKGE